MKILVACGGTGGHIFPALGFLGRLESKLINLEPLLVVTKRDIENLIIPKKYKVAHISAQALKKGAGLKNLGAAFNLFKAAVETIVIIIKFHPDLVVGFGGYASFLPVFFAWALRIKTVIHEQNVKIGLANRILAYFVNHIAISFIQAKEYIKFGREKAVLTGNFLRDEFLKVDREEALRFFGFSKDKFTILVTGGSLGAHKINMEFSEALGLAKKRTDLQVIHLSGPADYAFLENSYKDLDIEVKLFKFLKEIHYAYMAADLAVCRAGAMTISELIFFKLPAIIIPYPHGRADQEPNARVVVDQGAAILIKDDSLDAKALSDSILELHGDRRRINKMRSNYKNIDRVNEGQGLVKLALSQ